MVHIIPLSVGQRRLDTGNAVQDPQGSSIGGAMQGFGDHLSALAKRYQQMKDQQDAFDAELARRGFDVRIAQAEDELAANAPADGAGMHEAMYGEVDLRAGRVVKTGLFDTLFDDAKRTMPESQRAAFADQKENKRVVGAYRMALRQKTRRDDYEKAIVDTTLTTGAIAIAKGDPNDTATFEAIRQNGFDLIAKIGNPLARQAAEAAWRTNSAKALVQAMIAQDPKRVAEMLDAAQARGRAEDGTAQAVSDQRRSATSALASTGDHVSELMPEEGEAQSNGMAVRAASPWIADLPPNDLQDLGQKAQVAMTEQIFDARTNVQLAYQNAPDALMYTGTYSGKRPGDEDLAAVYGVEEGGRQSIELDRTFKVGTQAFDMVRMPKNAIEAKVLAAKPKPGSSTPEQDQAQFDIATSAAKQVLQARAVDPADFVRKIDQASYADWNAISSKDSYDPSAFQKAVARSVAVQLQLGIKKIQPLPMSVVKDLVDTLNDDRVPQRERDVVLRDLFAGTSDPGVQAAMALQLTGENQSRIGRSIASSLAPISAEERVSRNLAAFDALPLPLKPLVALDDTVRLMADGMTFGYADKFAATMNSLMSGGSYEEQLAAERASTQDARDRSGSAGTAAEFIGAYLTGRGLGEAGITLSGRFGTAAMEGFSGLLARTGLIGAEGAGYGAVEAAGRDESIGSGTAFGFLGGAGSNIIGEGFGVAYRQAADWLKRRSSSREAIAEPAATEVTPDTSGPAANPSSREEAPTSPTTDPATTSEANVGQDLHLNYMPDWDDAQRAAADLKVKILTEADTIVSRAVRLYGSARRRFVAAGNQVIAGSHVDHRVDLQLGGSDTIDNMALLDASVNTSLGSQINHLVKNLPHGTRINKVTIGDRGVRDISQKLPGG